MRSRIATISAMAAAMLAAALATSCILDERIVSVPGEAVTLLLDPSAAGTSHTRSSYTGEGGTDPWVLDSDGKNGSELDNTIATFRVLVYDHETHVLKSDEASGNWNFTIDVTEDAPYPINVTAGTYDFVFIANEGAELRTTLNQITATATAGKNNISLFDITPITDINDTDPIPMVTVVENVEVRAGSRVSIDGAAEIPADEDDPWKVGMESVAVRLSMAVWISDEQYSRWTAYHTLAGDTAPCIVLRNSRSAAFVTPDRDNSTYTAVRRITAGTAGSGHPAVITGETDNEGRTKIFIDRVIIPEVIFKPTYEISNALSMSLLFNFGDTYQEKIIELYDPQAAAAYESDYTLPRNTWLWIDAYVSDDPT